MNDGISFIICYGIATTLALFTCTLEVYFRTLKSNSNYCALLIILINRIITACKGLEGPLILKDNL